MLGRLDRGIGDRRRQRRLHVAVALAHGPGAQMRHRGGVHALADIRTVLRPRYRCPGIAALAAALHQGHADQPLTARIVRAQHRRGRLAVERERPLPSVEARLRRPAPEGETPAHAVLLPGRREAAAEQRLEPGHGVRPRVACPGHRSGGEAMSVMIDCAAAPTVGGSAEGARDIGLRASMSSSARLPGAGIVVRRPRTRQEPPKPSACPATVPCTPAAARSRDAAGNAVQRLLRRRAPEPRQPCRRHRVVIDDGAHRNPVRNRHRHTGRAVHAGIEQHHLEGLRILVMAVVVEGDMDLRLGLARPGTGPCSCQDRCHAR